MVVVVDDLVGADGLGVLRRRAQTLDRHPAQHSDTRNGEHAQPATTAALRPNRAFIIAPSGSMADAPGQRASNSR